MLMRVDGQWASEPLISNEQYPIGGAAGPRGYIEGERFGDHGARATIEPRLPTFDIGMVDGTMPMKLRISVFNDLAVSELIEPTGRRQTVRMWSTGISAAANMIAFRPDPHTRLIVVAEVVSRRPARSTAWRAGAWPTPA